MSTINDYETQRLSADRQHTFQAEVAEAHLARIARGDRPTWGQRLAHGLQQLFGQRPARPSRSVLRPRHSH